EPAVAPQGDHQRDEPWGRQGEIEHRANVSRSGGPDEAALDRVHPERHVRRSGADAGRAQASQAPTARGRAVAHPRWGGVDVSLPGNHAVPRPGAVSRAADRPACAQAELPRPNQRLHPEAAAKLPGPEHRLRSAADGYKPERRTLELPRSPDGAVE